MGGENLKEKTGNIFNNHKSIQLLRRNQMQKLISFFKDEEGATAVEYAIMVALIAIVVIAMVRLVGDKANEVFDEVQSQLESVIE